jgi:hypothetical protein
MSMPGPNDGRKRMSRSVKLAFMGVGGAALLYSCAPAIGGVGGLTALPFIMGMSNPFYRQPQNCGPAVPGAPPCDVNQASSSSGSSSSGYRGSGSSSTTSTSSSTSKSSSASQSTSSRGGFGSTASSHASSGSS